MSAKSRSIGQILSRTKTLERRAEIAQDWSHNWMQDQAGILRLLEQAERDRDWHRVGAAAAQLRAVTEKRFAAFPGVITKLTEQMCQSAEELDA